MQLGFLFEEFQPVAPLGQQRWMLLQLFPQLSTHRPCRGLEPQLVAPSWLQVHEASGTQLSGRGTSLYSSLASLKSLIFIFLSIFVVCLSSPSFIATFVSP